MGKRRLAKIEKIIDPNEKKGRNLSSGFRYNAMSVINSDIRKTD